MPFDFFHFAAKVIEICFYEDCNIADLGILGIIDLYRTGREDSLLCPTLLAFERNPGKRRLDTRHPWEEPIGE